MPNGKIKTIYKRAANITHAEQLADEIRAEFDFRGEKFIEGREKTFRDLAAWYKERYVTAPVYSADGKKISGMRSFVHEGKKIDRLTDFFGAMKISEIDERALHYFKKMREKKVKTSTINRDLETLRAMFGKARRQRWITANPFEFGENLIIKALEERRTVTLTDEEEDLILKAAKKLPQSRLYYLILVLRDTGARPSEIYPVNAFKSSEVKYEPVRWCDFFDYDFQAVKLTSFKGKAKQSRFAPVTTRVKAALMELWDSLKDEEKNLKNLIFPGKSYKTAWQQTLREAKLTGIRLRDLRRDFRTRLARAGYSDQLASRLLGHSTSNTTYHYTEADLAAVYLANDILNSQNIKTVSEAEN